MNHIIGRRMIGVVVLSLPLFLAPLSSEVGATGVEDAVLMEEWGKAKRKCEKLYYGPTLEWCLRKAWLEYQTKLRGLNEAQQAPLQQLVDQAREEMDEWCSEVEKEYRPVYEKMVKAIAECKFEELEPQKIEKLNDAIENCPWPPYPFNREVRNLRILASRRKGDLRDALQEAAAAPKEGKEAEIDCECWEVPQSLKDSEILRKCRPSLLNKLNEQEKRATKVAQDYEKFERAAQRALAVARAALRECTGLAAAKSRLDKIDESPFIGCGFDIAIEMVELYSELEAKMSDLEARKQRIRGILRKTNGSISECDWTALDKQISEAMLSLPEENCTVNYPGFLDLKDQIAGLEAKKEARKKEIALLARKIKVQLKLCEGYLKPLGGGKQWQKTWDQNVVKHYNDEKMALDSYVKEASNRGYTACLRELVASETAIVRGASAEV